jgi:GT2 family glycosyltransferase
VIGKLQAYRYGYVEQRGPREQIAARLREFRALIHSDRIAAVQRPAGWESRIEVVLPCFNHARYVCDALASVEAQTWREQAVTATLVDDASTDDSLRVIRELAAQPHRPGLQVKVIANDRNLLQGGAINRAVAESENDLFVMLNADDVLTPDCLATIVATYRRYIEIYLLGGSALPFADGTPLPPHEPGHVESLRLRVTTPKAARRFSRMNDLNMSQSSCSFFRVAWELVGGYFERDRRVCSHDDRDFQFRVASVLPVGVYRDYPMQFYRVNSSSGRGQA